MIDWLLALLLLLAVLAAAVADWTEQPREAPGALTTPGGALGRSRE